MHFQFNRVSQRAVDSSGAYVVAVEGDRYGTVLHISVVGNEPLRLWVRRTERPPHEVEMRSSSFAHATTLIVWIVDNRAGTGAPLLTLDERVGECSLGQLLQAFLSSYETAFDRHWDPLKKPLKVECRGNQRFRMEERFGP